MAAFFSPVVFSHLLDLAVYDYITANGRTGLIVRGQAQASPIHDIVHVGILSQDTNIIVLSTVQWLHVTL